MSRVGRTGIVTPIVAILAVGAAVASTVALTRDADRISAEELRRLPPIALAWAPSAHARYTAAGHLYVVGADGTEARLLRSSWATPRQRRNGWSENGVYEAHWSPDRRQIGVVIALYNGDPLPQVAVVSADGRRLRRLAPPSFDDNDLSWSPSGRALLYEDFNGEELRIVDSKSGELVRIRRSAHGPLRDAEWSPDGRRIVATSSRGIVTLAPDGSDLVLLTRSKHDFAPTWSPDGRRIAFVRTRPTRDVWVVGSDGKRLQRLARRVGVSRWTSLVWSPDGSSILFTETRGSDAELTHVGVVRGDGSGSGRLTTDGASSAIAWSPDGTRILFLRTTSHEESELWVMEADGERPTRLPFNKPGWSVLTADWS